MNLELFDSPGGAVFSPCRRYRTRWWRRWDPALPVLGFLMLNPSDADEVRPDPTCTRCVRRAKQGGYGAVEVVNLFALVSTDPKALYLPGQDPIGAGNDEAIALVAQSCQKLVCAWSTHARHLGRERQVLALLDELGVVPHVLAINKDGTPKHPLYVGYNVVPTPWQRDVAR